MGKALRITAPTISQTPTATERQSSKTRLAIAMVVALREQNASRSNPKRPITSLQQSLYRILRI